MKVNYASQFGTPDSKALDLTAFAREFKDEAHLRAVLAELLTKTGAKGVRITHGAGERGKDIIFYKSGGLSKDVLYACVVKNDRITGRADSKSGAQTVLNQALLALTEPYANRITGTEERVHTVYVISPLESTLEAVESIKTQLRERARQVEFICGIDLLAVFQEYWQDFLRFESAVQTRYLTSLRAGIVIDKALVTLLTRRNANLGLKPFEALYVPNGIELRIDKFSQPEILLPQAAILKNYITRAELKDAVFRLSFWRAALSATELLPFDPKDLKEFSEFITQFAMHEKDYWNNALQTKRKRPSDS